MAEPAGITGAAIGIVSFGLQLYTGISEYLDALKGRDKDLQFVKQHTGTLQDYLRSIEEALDTIGSDYTVARHAIERCKCSCEVELRGLETLLQELRAPFENRFNRTVKVKNSRRKFSYPFNKKSIVRLQERLNSTNNVLNMAILALQL
ncbi:hypothetical protein FANTH_6012 [Fusarium anthophilum]|uniref:Fungal N-terminal domain-containing protein n=1 Tax=Fusarium anthophilum TaxID=48485 RepID=A0A8H4ZM36_9HYPO|nr:hypothetical protein FANTH_6012 [Fusarium anthophilum]